MFFARGERPRCASPPARERLLGACGTRARQGAGRRRTAAPAWARRPEPGAQAPPFASPRAPSPLPPAPGEAAEKDSSSLGSGRTQRGNGAKTVAGTGPHAGWKIADKSILETAEPRKAGLFPRTPRRGPWSRPFLCAWLKRSRMWGSFGFPSVLTYTRKNLPLLRPPASPGAVSECAGVVGPAGWAGARRARGAGCSGAATEPAPCETVAPDTIPPARRERTEALGRAGPPHPRAHPPADPASRAVA